MRVMLVWMFSWLSLSLLIKISDPKSKEYGNHLSKEEVLELVSTSKEISQKIEKWIKETLENFQATDFTVENKGDVIVVQACVAGVEELLNTQICLYEHMKEPGRHTLRQCTGSLSYVPKDIHSHTTLVDGLIHFPVQKLHPVIESPTATYNVPSTIRAMYNIPAETHVTHPGATQCVMGSYKVGVGLVSDLNMFDKLNGISHQELTIVGTPLLNYSENIWLSVENALDIQYITGIAPNATTYFWTSAVGFPAFFSQLFNSNNTPLVGEQEPLNDIALIQVMEEELMKLGARGITVLASSGDTGAVGLNYNCSGDPNENGYFLPSYPATSPYVLAVGSTAVASSGPFANFYNQSLPICSNNSLPCTTLPASEVPAVTSNSFFSSGGGFSAFFPQPSYQANAVNNYLSLSIPFPYYALWNKSNRGFPDVAVIGQNVLIVNASQVQVEGGTSASAPIFAGIITLLNDYLLRNNKSPIGWAQPLLYQMAEECPQCYNQLEENKIGEYTDACSEGRQECCVKQGYVSAAIERGKWDPLTGLGSIDYVQTIQYLAMLHNIPIN